MKDEIHINSELVFFKRENTDGYIIFKKNKVKYHSLFDFPFFIDCLNEVEDDKTISSEKLVAILINYAINDA